jgi:hypothetical protein
MKELTDEQLNHHLCEWLGWTDFYQIGDRRFGIPPLQKNNGDNYRLIPNHLSGIEALGHVHAAEKMAFNESPKLWTEYLDVQLPAVVAESDNAVECATARQRTIAILRVVKPEIFQ